MSDWNKWMASAILRRSIATPVETFGRMAENERDPVAKLLYFGVCAAIPLALVGNAVNYQLGLGYPGGFLIVSGLFLLVHIPMALLLVKRCDLIPQRLRIKWLLSFLLFVLGALLVTGLFLWLFAILNANAAELKASMPEKVTPANMSDVKTSWGLLFGTLLALIAFLVVPLFISPLWTGAILQVMALFGKQPVVVSDGNKRLDDVDGHLEGAVETYCCAKDREEDDLSEDEWTYLLNVAASTPGFFMTWIIRKHFEGDIHREYPDVLELIRSGQMSGADFVIHYCDSKITEEDMCPNIREFAEKYYEHYYDDYFSWVGRYQNPETGLYNGTEEGYQEFSAIIERNYNAWLISQGAYGDMEVPDEVKNTDTPLHIWLEREVIPAALQTESYNIYVAAWSQTLALADLPEAERSSAFVEIIRNFVKAFNILERYNHFIETIEREELYDAALTLWRLAQDECALNMDEAAVMAAFDQDREW